MLRKGLLLAMCALLAVNVSAGEEDFSDPRDPWEGYNRAMYGFNSAVDRALLRPLAKGYQTVTPGVVRASVGNFFDNLDDVDNSVNNLLQGKPGRALGDLGRVLINTTLGCGGLFDVAAEFGLERNEEDFSQTLSRWGVPQGPYFVVPFMGPGTVSTFATRPVDTVMDPVRYLHPSDHRNVLIGLRFIDDREGLLSTERLMSGDEYIFVRDAFLQRRDYLINDGEVSDPFADDF